MELADIMPIEEWATLEQELRRISGLNVHAYDREGNHMTSHEASANNLCSLIRSGHEGLMTICSIAHQNVAAQARKSKEPVLSECDAGLVKFVVPIFSGEEFLGTIGGCGYRLPDVDIETFLIHKITGTDIEEVEKVASEVGLISEEKAAELMNDFQERVNEVLKRL